MLEKPDKKSLLYLGIVVAIAIFVCIGSFYFLSQMPEIEEVKPEEKKTERKSTEEIIRSLTAPEGETEPVSEEVIEGLTAPKSERKGSSPIPEDVIKNLTVPE